MGPVHIQRKQVTITLFPADRSYQPGDSSYEKPRAVLICRCYIRFLRDLGGASTLECILREAPLRTNGPRFLLIPSHNFRELVLFLFGGENSD